MIYQRCMADGGVQGSAGVTGNSHRKKKTVYVNQINHQIILYKSDL